MLTRIIRLELISDINIYIDKFSTKMNSCTFYISTDMRSIRSEDATPCILP